MRFIDEARLTVVGGRGGDGAVHFRREKFVARGGPDGGDGGRGGSVILAATGRSRSLLTYHYRRKYKAEDGVRGGSERSSGRSGADVELAVPIGTQIYDEETGELLGDLVEEGARCVVAAGGGGGAGNAHFATSTRQAPDFAKPGKPGQERAIRMELKLLADVALVGLPNAGKSTLIRSISSSRARVADYPFTTLVPNLGVVQHHGRTFTVADIPGLIEGASDGAGLGTRFLKHVERCAVLVYLLSPAEQTEAVAAWHILRAELQEHAAELVDRPSVVALSKADVLGEDADAWAAEVAARIGQPVLVVSGVSRRGVTALLDAVARHLQPQAAPAPESWSPLDA
jgi:GTP-binding protein